MAGEKVPLKDGKPRERSRFMVYVEVPVVVMKTVALVASNEADLNRQVTMRLDTCKTDAELAKAKIERDKKGEIIVSHLSKDWDR